MHRPDQPSQADPRCFERGFGAGWKWLGNGFMVVLRWFDGDFMVF